MPLLTKRGNSKLLDTATLTAPPTRTRTSAAPIRDWLIMSGRSLRMSRRNIEGLMTSVALPVLLMLIFVYLFGGAINTGSAYVTYVVPGVLVLCAGFGSAMTAVSVCNDMPTGVIDRFRSMDVSGAAVVGGHVVASVVRNAVSTALVLGVALLIGFRPHAGVVAWLAAAGILLLFILAISWLSAAVGLFAKSPDGASGFTFLLSFLPYPSSAFVPIRTMPIWLHGFASDQPVTPVIQSIRGYLLGQPVRTSPWFALACTAGILLVSVALCAVIFQRRVE
jgi:ABC-2 type transport system permease protein